MIDQASKIYATVLKLFIRHDLHCVKLPYAQTVNGTLTLIVDSGATNSLVRMSCIKPETRYDPFRRINMIGMAGERLTIGETSLNLKFGRKNVPTLFQLIDEPPPDNDGLLGQNVLDNCILDFRNKTLTLLEAPIKKKISNCR